MQISPVNRSKSAARRAYDRLSRVYDLLAGSSEAQFTHLGMEMLAVGLGETVLEIGSGTGKALIELCAHVGDSGSVHGIDLSPGMLQKSRDRLERSGASRRVSLLEGDGAHLPYQSGSFTAIFISFTLELFDTPEIPMVLAECQRVLKPGGRLGVVAMLKTNPPGPIVRLYEWFHDHIPTYVDCRPINAHQMIQAAGFSVEKRQVKSMWGLPVELLVARKLEPMLGGAA
jgi:demethylmenaquinone methyltransferase/2-methoxy-6-polyprenyl-1,4-benzoquinol methylase